MEGMGLAREGNNVVVMLALLPACCVRCYGKMVGMMRNGATMRLFWTRVLCGQSEGYACPDW